MTHDYVYDLGAADRDLSVRALDRNLVVKARNVLRWAYPGASLEAMQLAETARGVCWEYRQLAERAGVGEDELARDVWGAALSLSADRDMVLNQLGDKPARDRLAFLGALADERRGAAESSGAWAMIRRWHIHRLTPGWMTYGSLYASAKAGQAHDNNTRCIPEAHIRAADLASMHFKELRDAGDSYGWFDIHLFYRLGPYARLMDEKIRRDLVERLLLLGKLAPTPVQFLASELWDDADERQRTVALTLLEGWAIHARRRDAHRSAAILAIRAEAPIRDDALRVLEEAFKSEPTHDSMFTDFEGTGSLRLGTAPMVYPWLGQEVLTSYALIRIAELQPVTVSQTDIFRRIWRLRETHPSAAAILQRYFSALMTPSQRKKLRKVSRVWMQTHLVGHGEQSALPVLREE